MDFSVIPRNPPYMLQGFGLTVALALVSMSASLVTGTLFAMLRLSPNAWVRIPVGIFIDVMRTIPGPAPPLE